MKRWISILLALLLVFSFAPGRFVPVYAEDSGEEPEVVGESFEPDVLSVGTVDLGELTGESVDPEPDIEQPVQQEEPVVTPDETGVAPEEIPAGTEGAADDPEVPGEDAPADDAGEIMDAEALGLILAADGAEGADSDGETVPDENLPASDLFMLEARSVELPVGSTYTIKAVTCDGAPIDKSDLTFEIEDDGAGETPVATVNESGVVTANAAGDASVLVTYQNETLASAIRVPEEPTSIRLNATAITIGLAEVYSGFKVAEMLPAGTNSTLTWCTSNKKYVAVNARTGAIKGVKRGSAYIYAVTRSGVRSSLCKVTVKKKPSKITLPKAYNVGLGLAGRKIGFKLSSGSASANITWYSGNKAVVEVDPATGVLFPKAVGTAKVIAKTYNGKKSKNCIVSVRPDPTGVALLKTANVNVGASITLTPIMTPSSALAANMTYASSDPSVATVNSAGKVTGLKVGRATITATTYNGISTDVANSCVVHVCTPPSKVALNKTSITLGVGMTYTLIPTISPDTEDTNPNVSWSTSKKKYATVNANGVVTAKKKGTAKITVKTSNGKKATCTVKVVAAPKSIALSPKAVTLAAGGMRFKLTASIKPSGARASITYTSSDPEVADVLDGYIVTGDKTGTAKITARTQNGKSAVCTVTVKGTPNSASFAVTSKTISLYQTYTPSVNVLAADGSATIANLTFSVVQSSGDPGCISVNASTGVITPKAEGKAYVSATTHNGVPFSNTLEITVERNQAIEAVIAKAVSKLGAKYVYGGGYKTASPSGFDCSGFTYWSYYYGTNKSVTLGTSAYKQGNDSRFVNKRVYGWENCERGDILCFRSDSSATISHVGLYLGNGKFIHASDSSNKVIYSYFNSGSSANYWKRNLKWGYHVF